MRKDRADVRTAEERESESDFESERERVRASERVRTPSRAYTLLDGF